MQSHIQQIMQYTENQIQIFSHAECPTISNAFKQLYDILDNLKKISTRQPLSPQTINLYNNALYEIENKYKKLAFYGPDFTERINKYKKFKSDIDLMITQTLHRYNQSSNTY